MFSPENTTLTTVVENQNIANVAVTYILTQPNITIGYNYFNGQWGQYSGTGVGSTVTNTKEVTLTAVKDNSTVVIDGSRITGYFTDCFDNTISYRTKDNQFVTVTKWTDIAMAIANDTLSELYYYKADPRTTVVYDYIASVDPSPVTYLFTDVAFINGVATITLPDQNAVFIGGAGKTLDYNTIVANYKITITNSNNGKYTTLNDLEFATSELYNGGAGVYGFAGGNIILKQNSFNLNPGRTIVSSANGRTLTLTLDLSNTTLAGDGTMSIGTFYAAITAKYVSGKTYHINVDNDWMSGRNQLIKFTNLTKYQQEYLVQWINNNSDTVTWKNNVLDAVDWENSNL